MATYSCPIPLDQFPPDLIQAVAQDAAADAYRVAWFLDGLNLQPTDEAGAPTRLSLPVYFLTGLAAALRLLAWEQRSLRIHRDAGLPSAREAIREVFGLVTAPEPVEEKERRAKQLGCRVLAVSVERLAWNGQALLGADVELREADEDALVDALAKFLWAHRHDGGGPGQTDRGEP